jgi:hypothetical protein
LYARRLTKKREGPAPPGQPSGIAETTIRPYSIRRPQGASLAAIVLAGAAAAAQAHTPSPRQATASCQAGSPSGLACGGTQRIDAAAGRRRPDGTTLRDCRVLESAIVESEQAERRARAAMMESIQQDLSILRKRFRRLGCFRLPSRAS